MISVSACGKAAAKVRDAAERVTPKHLLPDGLMPAVIPARMSAASNRIASLTLHGGKVLVLRAVARVGNIRTAAGRMAGLLS